MVGTSDLFTSFSFYMENFLILEVQSSNGFLLWGSFQFKDRLYEQYDKPWITQVIEAGANALVAGSAVFGAKSYADGMWDCFNWWSCPSSFPCYCVLLTSMQYLLLPFLTHFLIYWSMILRLISHWRGFNDFSLDFCFGNRDHVLHFTMWFSQCFLMWWLGTAIRGIKTSKRPAAAAVAA